MPTLHWIGRKAVKYYQHWTLLWLFSLCFFFFCSSPDNPYEDVRNTDITDLTISTPSNQSYKTGDTVSLVAHLIVSQYVDSIRVSFGDYWSIVRINDGAWYQGDTAIFQKILDSAGVSIIRVTVFIHDGRMAYKELQITVLGSPPVVTGNPSPHITLIEGQSLNLIVTATGTRPMTFIWTKNGDTIASLNSGTYIKSHVAIADTGNYRCLVRNAWGMDLSDNIVILISPATGPPAPARLSIISLTDSSITLRWNSVDSVNGYHIYRAMVDSFVFASVIDTVSTVFFVDAFAASSPDYFYWVTAFSGTKESIPTNSISTRDSVSKTINSAPYWMHDTLQMSSFEGAYVIVNLADSCHDNDSNSILSIYIPADTVLSARISGDTALIFNPGRRSAGTYVMPIVVSDGLATDTGWVRLVIAPTYVSIALGSANHGTIALNPDTNSFRYSDTVIIIAIADSGYAFDTWTGTLAGKLSQAEIIMLSDTTISALFARIPECISIPSGSSINQTISQTINRPTVYCLEPDGTYENGTITAIGDVRIIIQ